MNRVAFDRRTQLVFLLPTFAIIFNCLLSFFPRQSGLALIKGLFFIGLLTYLYIGKFANSLNKFSIFFFLIIYWFLLIPFSTGVERSFEYVLKNSISILMLPLGYCYINTPPKMIRFIYTQLNLLIIFVVFAILSNVFKWGVNQYGSVGGIRVGLYDAQLYGPAVILALVPFVFQTNRLSELKKYRIYLIGFLAFLLLVFSIRRTSILIVVAGISIFYITRGKVHKLISLLLGAFILLLVTFPLYGGFLMERMQMRSNVFSSDYEMTDELRYQELFFVLKDLNENFSVTTLLFGKEIFNSPGHYGFTEGFLAIRQLHVDYTVLFHGTGLFGLTVYLGLFVRCYQLFIRKFKKFKSIFPQFGKDIKAVFLTSIGLLLLIHFSGQMEELNFRSPLFLTIGGCIGLVYNMTARTIQTSAIPENEVTTGEEIRIKLQPV